MELRAHDCELATHLFQRLITPTDFVLRSSGATEPEEFDFLQSHGLEIFSMAVRSLIQKSLESGSRSLEGLLYEDLLMAVNRTRVAGGTGREVMTIPLFQVYSEFEEAVGRIHTLGFSSIVDGHSPDLDIISEVVIDPLRESS
jgi:hypothetical protein